MPSLSFKSMYFVAIRKKVFIYKIFHLVRQENPIKTAEDPIKDGR